MKKLFPRHGGNLCRIEVHDLSVQSGADRILEQINISIRCGEMTALVGPNGAGKTTFIKALLRQIPYSGTVDHVDKEGRHLSQIRVGYVPQQLYFDKNIPASVSDVVAATLTRRPVWLGISRKDKEQVLSVLQMADAKDLAMRRLGDLSGGEMQRVLLALALHPLPQLLILDEPVSGVDANGLQLFLHTVSELKEQKNIAVLIVSHDWGMVRAYADQVILLDKSILEAGTPERVFASEAFIQAFPMGGTGK